MMCLRGLLLISLAIASCPSEGQASTFELMRDVTEALIEKPVTLIVPTLRQREGSLGPLTAYGCA